MHCDVLYLCLEDTQRRIKDRLFDLTNDPPRSFHLSVTCGLIGNGLEEEIINFLEDFPKTKLVIIDTLQKVRDSKGSAGKTECTATITMTFPPLSGSQMSTIFPLFSSIICEKLKDGDDPFNEVSALPASPERRTPIMLKRKRSSRDATLLACGRDVEYQELTLRFQDLKWELVEHKTQKKSAKRKSRSSFRVAEFMKSRTEWVGTATDLIADMAETETTPNVVTKYLGQFSNEVLEPAGIEYRTKRTGQSRLIKFIRHDGGDANDGANDI